MVLTVKGIEDRHFDSAGRAPGRPIMDYRDLASEVERLAIQCSRRLKRRGTHWCGKQQKTGGKQRVMAKHVSS